MHNYNSHFANVLDIIFINLQFEIQFLLKSQFKCATSEHNMTLWSQHYN